MEHQNPIDGEWDALDFNDFKRICHQINKPHIKSLNLPLGEMARALVKGTRAAIASGKLKDADLYIAVRYASQISGIPCTVLLVDLALFERAYNQVKYSKINNQAGEGL